MKALTTDSHLRSRIAARILLFFFVGIISTAMSQAQTVNYQTLYTNATFSKTIDQSKPIGAIPGSVDVTLTGGASYIIPIAGPVGTLGMEPKLSLRYSSQGQNGIAGWGWEIAGLSAIMRTSKNNFLDDEVKPVLFSAEDVYSLDGSRLYASNGIYGADGTTYNKEQIDFSNIISHYTVGSGPKYFTVKDRMGTTYEYGNTSDSRVLSDDGTNVMIWRLNKVTDVHGNYIEYVYYFTGRQTIPKEINYTGNANTGMAPYNKIEFVYADGRIDKNTVYEGGASLNTKSILASIRITGEGQIPFKMYAFEYAKDDLYSYLQEVKEYGADNYVSQLNSTIFKYGEQATDYTKTDFTLSNIAGINEMDFLSSLDLDGDGVNEILVNETAAPNNHVANISLYKKLPNGIYSYKGFYTPPGDQLAYKYNKNGKIKYAYVSGTNGSSFSNADFNGDGKDDILSITSTGVSNIQTLGTMGIVSFNMANSPPYYFLPVTLNLALPTANGFLDVDIEKTYQCIGDFDGDARVDLILISTGKVPEGGQMIRRFRPYLYAAANNYSPKPIRNLILPSTTLPNNEYTNMIDDAFGADKELNVVNFDGDGKADILAKITGTSYVFSLSLNQNNEYEASVVTVNTDLFKQDIFQGDFNGDGKTDILSHNPVSGQNPAWYINYSTGKKFVSSVWNFNMATEMSNSITMPVVLHPKDKLIIADFNGDGKSDILHGKSSLTSNFCASNVFYMDLYYSKGMDFNLKSFTDQNNILSCPGNGQTPFPDNDFLGTELNGDGKIDVLIRTTTAGSPVSKLSFKENGEETLLQKVTDGNNNTLIISYDPLTKGLPLHEAGGIAPVTANNFDVEYPLTSIQVPMYVVSNISEPDGIGGSNNTQYTYKEALSMRSKRGFLGFSAITTTNSTMNTMKVFNYMPKLDRCEIWLKNSENYLWINNNSSLVSKISYNNSFETYGGKLYQQRNLDVSNYNALQGHSQKTTNQAFDYWGNITQQKEEITFNGNIHENTTILNQYVTPGNASLIPSVLSQTDISKTRNGAATVNKQNTFTYYTQGTIKKSTEYANTPNAVSTNNTYNTTGNVSTVSLDATGMSTRKKSYTYDSKQRFPVNILISTVPAVNGLVFNEYFNRELLWGKLISHTSNDCQNTTYTYDAFGRLKQTNFKVNTPDAYTVSISRGWYINALTNTFEAVSHPGKPDETIYYDKLGRKILSSFKGFSNQEVYTATSYDSRHNVATETNSYLASETPVVTSYTYDNMNRLITKANNLATFTTSYTFANGNLETTNVNTNTSQTKSIVTDPTGKVFYSSDDGGAIDFTYDSWGNEIKAKRGGQVFTTKSYDAYNRLISSTDANAGSQSYTYDAFGQLIQKIDALGNTYDYLYDEIGRIKEKIGSEGAITYTYGDGLNSCKDGYLTHTDNFNGVKEDYEYDGYGRLNTKKTNIDGNNYMHKYTYDLYDNITSHDYPSGFKTLSEYTADGYLNKVGYVPVVNGPIDYFYTAQEFNGMGQAKKYLLGNGYTTTKNYTYGYLMNHKAKLNADVLHDMTYAYNFANGNMMSRQDNTFAVPFSESFAYDDLDRLTSSQVTNTMTNFAFPAITYQYDGINSGKGNIAHNSSVANFGGYAAPKYHALHTAQAVVVPIPGVVQAPTTPNTNLISDIDQNITYTPFNKTDKITEDNKEIEYTYNANYDRVKTVYTDNNTNEVTTKYYFGDYETLTTPLGETSHIHYISGGDGLCAMVTIDDISTKVHYVYTDHLGSINKVTDVSGNIEAEQNFDAWGRMRDPHDWTQIYSSVNTNTGVPEWLYRGYTGHEHLPEFGLINMNGRMYDPALGRMCSPDRYIQAKYNSQSYNRYSYCLNNPLKYTDPSGNRWFHWAAAELLTGGAVSMAFAATSTFAAATATTALLHFTSTNSTPISSATQASGAGFMNSLVTGENLSTAFAAGGTRMNNNWSIWAGQFRGNGRQIFSRHTWESFQNGIGLQYALFANQAYDNVVVDNFDGATTISYANFPGGQQSAVTLGSYIQGGPGLQATPGNTLFMHEYGHYLQSQSSGPLYLYKYGMPSGLTLTPFGFNNGAGLPDDFWVEQDANTRGFNYFNRNHGVTDAQWDRNFIRGGIREVQWYEPFIFILNPLVIIYNNRNN